MSSIVADEDEFLFGVATSDHQTEAYDPRFPDIWDAWEERRGMTPRGRGTDFWNRYREDIELARDLGCRAFRFSISWARVEPRPGEWNSDALEHYADVICAIREAGMQPVVTLLHWVWPLHIEERGGLAADEFPHWFAAYADQVARRIGQDVAFWISINEPNALPFGYIRYWWQEEYPMPPGLGHAPSSQQVETVGRVIRNLFRAHTQARAAIREACPGARVSANPCHLGFPKWFQEWLDWRAIHSGTEEQWAHNEEAYSGSGPHPPRTWMGRLGRMWGSLRKLRAIGTLANPTWWHLGMAGRLPPFLCPPECVGAQDYVALDYYWGIQAMRVDAVLSMLGAMQQQFAQAPVWSKGLYNSLRYVQRLFPGQDILIAENGCPRREDPTPSEYLKRHIGEVARARRHGAPVIGYLCWSITTGREWGLPEIPGADFGLYRVDLDGDPELRRVPTEAAEGYRELIATAMSTAKKRL